MRRLDDKRMMYLMGNAARCFDGRGRRRWVAVVGWKDGQRERHNAVAGRTSD